MRDAEDAAIIGAGPYGLSIAAHLRTHGVQHRIFGTPMHTWRTQMPRGMFLKSDGFASSLFDPQSAFTLAAYAAARQIPYADEGLPVSLETFSDYGVEFQRRLVPHLEDRQVVALEQTPAGFRLSLDDGSTALARKVVVAAGISHFSYLPPALTGLPEALVSHSSRHGDMSTFAGREVAVVGAGASALDCAALLRQSGARGHLVSRRSAIRFHPPPKSQPRPIATRIRAPRTGLGPGWRSFLCVHAPLAFHSMPENLRLMVVRRHLGPAGGWFIKEHVVGHMPFHLGVDIQRAEARDGRVHLHLRGSSGEVQALAVDHVLAATGYRVDARRLPFLGDSLLSRLRVVENSPVLSSHFESSVDGLYFVGTAAAACFGPLMRFAYGAGFTAGRLSRHLARSQPRRLVPAARQLADI